MAHGSQNTHGSHGHGHGHHGPEGAHTHGALKQYVIGFVLSIILTIIPLMVVMNDLLEGTAAIVVLLVAAVLQFAVQLLFFMHLREEEKPRYNLMTLVFGLVILITIVGGSIWIMAYNVVGS
ncbi:MAG TPA: cytochrome o ubiquinol oxidase subunit IV [Paenibacillus sp.]|uniref:cytochrome o ubiquinol oxidase subunit IV n=1 Tax=Paenibacillus sp. TaxID=58172 RepID=UPI0028D483CC|nr:cytochrome o ubiquinol oxidase subunit IV [Paenibacillus sp.]HUC93830.1 cytochrome o ubiquinol oxidase subunit IV [Paenibacillus sp.]